MKSFITAAFLIARKDVVSELRTRETISTVVVFSVAVMLIFGFALDLGDEFIAMAAPGILWATYYFASVLLLNRSFAREKKNSAIEALLISPIDRSSIYLGKLIANYFFVIVLQAISIPIFIVLFNFDLKGGFVKFLGIVLLGDFGMISVGTFLAALASNVRASEMLLPVIFFPLVMPVLIITVRLSSAYLNPALGIETSGMLRILAVYCAIFFVLSIMLFDYVIE
ncbi:MAG: heme exporter protein CcmB [Actinobacteria bacterium]|nr:heme exporter protein CcmB [Actinomycetota bacterium]